MTTTTAADTSSASVPDGATSGVPKSDSGRRRLRAVGAVAAPTLTGAVALAVLSAWTATGGAGTLARIHLTVAGGMVTAPADADTAAAYLTITNTGAQDDELLSVTTPAADRTMLADNTETPGEGAGVMTRLSGITVPAHTTVALGPYGRDIMLMRPAPLAVGHRITLTLHFRVVGARDVQATVIPLGTTPG